MSRQLFCCDSFLSVIAFVFMLKSFWMAEKELTMKEINIKADLWKLTPDWAVAGTRGSFGSCRIVFDFSPDWQCMNKRITFFPAGGGESILLILSGNTVRVPDEVMARAGTASFVLDGIDPDGNRLVSARGELRVIDTAFPGGREPKEYAPSEIDQLRAALESLSREVEAMKKEAA